MAPIQRTTPPMLVGASRRVLVPLVLASTFASPLRFGGVRAAARRALPRRS